MLAWLACKGGRQGLARVRRAWAGVATANLASRGMPCAPHVSRITLRTCRACHALAWPLHLACLARRLCIQHKPKCSMLTPFNQIPRLSLLTQHTSQPTPLLHITHFLSQSTNLTLKLNIIKSITQMKIFPFTKLLENVLTFLP